VRTKKAPAASLETASRDSTLSANEGLEKRRGIRISQHVHYDTNQDEARNRSAQQVGRCLVLQHSGKRVTFG
jgi:hypothetical protein